MAGAVARIGGGDLDCAAAARPLQREVSHESVLVDDGAAIIGVEDVGHEILEIGGNNVGPRLDQHLRLAAVVGGGPAAGEEVAGDLQRGGNGSGLRQERDRFRA